MYNPIEKKFSVIWHTNKSFPESENIQSASKTGIVPSNVTIHGRFEDKFVISHRPVL